MNILVVININTKGKFRILWVVIFLIELVFSLIIFVNPWLVKQNIITQYIPTNILVIIANIVVVLNIVITVEFIKISLIKLIEGGAAIFTIQAVNQPNIIAVFVLLRPFMICEFRDPIFSYIIFIE